MNSVKPAAGRYPKKFKRWHHDSAVKLIAQVKRHRCLWDENLESIDEHTKMAAWKEVSLAFEGLYSPNNCFKKWKEMKAAYRKVKEPAPKNSSWCHFSAMSFICREKNAADDESTATQNGSISFDISGSDDTAEINQRVSELPNMSMCMYPAPLQSPYKNSGPMVSQPVAIATEAAMRHDRRTSGPMITQQIAITTEGTMHRDDRTPGPMVSQPVASPSETGMRHDIKIFCNFLNEQLRHVPEHNSKTILRHLGRELFDKLDEFDARQPRVQIDETIDLIKMDRY